MQKDESQRDWLHIYWEATALGRKAEVTEPERAAAIDDVQQSENLLRGFSRKWLKTLYGSSSSSKA